MYHVECYQPSPASDVQQESIRNPQMIEVFHWVLLACIRLSSIFCQQMSSVCHVATTHARWMSMRNPQKQIAPIQLSLKSTSTLDRTCSDILTDSNTDFEVYVWIGRCSTASLPGRPIMVLGVNVVSTHATVMTACSVGHFLSTVSLVLHRW